MPAAQHSARHIRAHFSQTYHSELHVRSLKIVPERDFIQGWWRGRPAGVVLKTACFQREAFSPTPE
jgi:hypothetical protein